MKKLSIVFFSSFAHANEQLCKNNAINFNICDEAKRLAEKEVKKLPYKITERVQIVSFAAEGNVLSQGVKLLYDRTFFEQAIIQQGRSLDGMKKQMFENSKQITCMNDASKAFVDLGGHMRFLYEFMNGETLFEFYVSVC